MQAMANNVPHRMNFEQDEESIDSVHLSKDVGLAFENNSSSDEDPNQINSKAVNKNKKHVVMEVVDDSDSSSSESISLSSIASFKESENSKSMKASSKSNRKRTADLSTK